MSIKVVADSSANMLQSAEGNLAVVPLTIHAGERSYRDDENLNVPQMLKELAEYKGRSSTACPAPGEWLEAFGEAEQVMGVSITSYLSGCYNSSQVAAEIYERENPGRRVFILDSRSTGPHMALNVEKLQELAKRDISFDQARQEINEYFAHTGLVFMLSSLSNFVKNGRVSPALGKLVEVLNIRIVGIANEEGNLEPLHKARGDRGGLKQLWSTLKQQGYRGGKMLITHTQQQELALELQRSVKAEFPQAEVRVRANRGLCSYYAQEGSILVGYEKA